MTAIEFKNVSKSFNSVEDRHYSIKTMMVNALLFRFKGAKKSRREVFTNVTLKIKPGEFVGMLGRNGVGKSTLLKLISGIYQPTTGQIITNGQIAPLLELGAGFATELSGFENIFLNASILGFSRTQAQHKLKEIVEFSELTEEAIRKPVRNYSSGMLVRLGFSIAAHLDAPILLFDEILAVGDIGFQKKCLAKIAELHKEGRTIVLVTHSTDQVRATCTRSIVIDRNGVAFDGDPMEGASLYESFFT